MTRLRRHLATTLLLALGIAGCSNGPKVVRPGTTPVVATAAFEIDGILAQLIRGEVEAASKRLAAALRRDPMNPSLVLLSDSISRDPKDLLGPDSYGYTVRSGDTIIALSERFLGNRLKAYQLARYNGLANSSILATGQALRIPGAAPRVEPVRRPEPRPSIGPAPAKPRVVAPKPVAPRAPVADPRAAGRLRAAGLAALNQGNVARAVSLLRQARASSPADPAIARDLARAERIAATVKSRR